MSNTFPLQHGNTWRRPDIAYADYQDQARNINQDEIEWNGRYKRIRELRDLSVLGMVLCELYGTPFYVQMNDIDDSPDAFVMRQAPNEDLSVDIGPVELTFYGRNRNGLPKKTLLDKLSEPKGKFSKLPERYLLTIHIGKGLNVNHLDIAKKLREIDAKFQVFSLQEISNYPDTIVSFVTYSPECKQKNINIGKIAHKLQKSGLHGELKQQRGRPPVT